MRSSIIYLTITFTVVSFAACKKDPPVFFTGPVDSIYDPTPYILTLPEGFPEMEIPADNPLTVEGVMLGRRLFFDPILSIDSSQSCSSCHNPEFSFTDNQKTFSVDALGNQVRRHAPAIINAGWIPELFWDGRGEDLLDQAQNALLIEQHVEWDVVLPKIEQHALYPGLFFDAFGSRNISPDLILKAIVQFERTLISGNSKFDRFMRGEANLSPAEFRGFEIFKTEKGDCFHCHGTILFTDNLFHNNGLDSVFANDKGRYELTGDPNDIGQFKTPTLRNIEFTAPYMHDGRFATLEEVVDFYSEGLQQSATIDPLMKKIDQGGIQLTEQEKQDLIAFLKTLSDAEFINNPEHQNPVQ